VISLYLSDGLIHEDRVFENGSAKREEDRAQDDGGRHRAH
jgi:hypothetical protein